MTHPGKHLDGFEAALDSIGKARIGLTLSLVRSVLRDGPDADESATAAGLAVTGLTFRGLTRDEDPSPDDTFMGAAAAMLIFEAMARNGRCSDAEAAASMLSVVAAMPADLRAMATRVGRALPEDA